MNVLEGFIAWPLGLRYVSIAVLGLVAGAIINWAAYSLAYDATYRSPWSRKHPRDARRSLWDRLPIFGWRRLRHLEGKADFPPGFWIRPLVIEAACALGFVAWYWYECVAGGLLHPRIAPGLIAVNPILSLILHSGCAAHLTLFAFMLAASLIDLDEWNIPDAVTIPGTIVGVVLLTLLPAQLPAYFDRRLMVVPQPLDAARPFAWPASWNAGELSALAVALACVLGWCVALLVGGRFPRLRAGRNRWGIAGRLFVRRIVRDSATPWVAGAGVLGCSATVAVWKFAPAHWYALLSSLLGLAAGGGMVWAVRILGGWAFQKEAMGFGDVTLMAMIGAYLGWQPTLLVFFAAPVAALPVYGVAYLLQKLQDDRQNALRRNVPDDLAEDELFSLPYGPYLCFAAFGVVWLWGPIWHWAEPRFVLAWVVPAVLLIGFPLYGVLRSLVLKLRGVPYMR